MSSLNSLIESFHRLDSLVSAHPEEMQAGALGSQFADIKERFEHVEKNPQATIIFYGIYNSGKSTLINALLGKEVAPMGDYPLTAQPTPYVWRHYTLWDSPGIDAPIEHQKVTDNLVRLAHISIFVANTKGISQERKFIDDLAYHINQGKKIFLVFNQKDAISDADFQRIVDEIFEQLQKRGCQLRFDIVKLNAKTALKAKLEHKPKLLEHSGLPEFESKLERFIESNQNAAMISALATKVNGYIDTVLNGVNTKLSSVDDKKSFSLLQMLQFKQSQLQQSVQSAIQFQALQVKDKAQQILRSMLDGGGDSSAAQQRIESMLQNALSSLHQRVSGELNFFYQDSGQLLSKLKLADKINLSGNMSYSQNMATSKVNIRSSESSSSSSSFSKSDIMQAGVALMPLLSKLPILGKYIPVVGPVLAVGLMLFGKSNDDSKLREEYLQEKERRAARERAIQHINNTAQEIGSKFETDVTDHLLSAVNEIVQAQIDSIQQQMQSSQDDLMTLLQQLQSIKTKVEMALNQVNSTGR